MYTVFSNFIVQQYKNQQVCSTFIKIQILDFRKCKNYVTRNVRYRYNPTTVPPSDPGYSLGDPLNLKVVQQL